MDSSRYNAIALKHFLQMAVPIAITKIKKCGGVGDLDRKGLDAFCHEFCEKADVIVCGTATPETGKIAGKMAEMLATALEGRNDAAIAPLKLLPTSPNCQ